MSVGHIVSLVANPHFTISATKQHAKRSVKDSSSGCNLGHPSISTWQKMQLMVIGLSENDNDSVKHIARLVILGYERIV